MSGAHAGSPELIPGGVPIDRVPGLDAAQADSLRDLWITTAQQLVGLYGTNETTRVRLAAMLDVPRTALDGLVNTAQRLIPLARSPQDPALAFEVATAGYPLGALLEDPAVAASRTAKLPAYRGDVRASLPAGCSLLEQLPPLRRQGQRPTCVAFAVLAVREQLEMAAGAPGDLDLSEQYVYWWCKERDGLPGRNGTYLSLGMRCLNETGAPFESLWPYIPIPTEEPGQGPPPAAAAAGDPGFATEQTQEFRRDDITGMKTCIAEGRSIAFSLPVFDSWFKSSAMARWGVITMPLPAEPPREGHALAIAGYQDEPGAPGGGYFLVRNSWQPWAWDSAWQPGYGCIPYAYASRYASTVFSARRRASGRPVAGGQASEAQPDLILGRTEIWLRQAPDGGELPQAAVAGRECAIYVRLQNPGATYLYRVRGVVYCEQAGTGQWQRAGEFSAPPLRPGTTLIGPISWQPPFSGMTTFAVRLE